MCKQKEEKMQPIRSQIHNVVVWSQREIDRLTPKNGVWILTFPSSDKYDAVLIAVNGYIGRTTIFKQDSQKTFGIAEFKSSLYEEFKSPMVFTGPFNDTPEAWKYFFNFGNQANVELAKANKAKKFAMAQKKVSMAGLGFGLLGEAEGAADLKLAEVLAEAASISTAKAPNDTSLPLETDLSKITTPTLIINSSGTPGNVILPEITAPIPENSTVATNVDLVASGTNTVVATVATDKNGTVVQTTVPSTVAGPGSAADKVATHLNDKGNRKFWYGVAAIAGLWLLLKK